MEKLKQRWGLTSNFQVLLIIVVFSIIVQGLTVGKLIKKFLKEKVMAKEKMKCFLRLFCLLILEKEMMIFL